jgi:hypothetical protein
LAPFDMNADGGRRCLERAGKGRGVNLCEICGVLLRPNESGQIPLDRMYLKFLHVETKLQSGCDVSVDPRIRGYPRLTLERI